MYPNVSGFVTTWMMANVDIIARNLWKPPFPTKPSISRGVCIHSSRQWSHRKLKLICQGHCSSHLSLDLESNSQIHVKVGSRYLFAVSAVVPVVGVESRPRRNGEQHFLLRGVRSGEPDVSERKFRRDRDRVPRRVASIVSRRQDSPKPLPFTLSLVSALRVI